MQGCPLLQNEPQLLLWVQSTARESLPFSASPGERKIHLQELFICSIDLLDSLWFLYFLRSSRGFGCSSSGVGREVIQRVTCWLLTWLGFVPFSVWISLLFHVFVKPAS